MLRRIPFSLVAAFRSPTISSVSMSHGGHFLTVPHGSIVNTASFTRLQPVLARRLAFASSREVDAMWIAAKKGFERFMPKNGTPSGSKAESKVRDVFSFLHFVTLLSASR
jgi:hypothetical protein